MSICQICKQRNATVHLTQIVNGIKTDVSVCSQCAGNSTIKLDINSLLTGLLGVPTQEKMHNEKTPACDNCGMTVDDFNSTGKLGCAKCYEVLFEPMKTLLNRIHGKTHHTGKTPKKQAQAQVQGQIEILREELAACIKAEAYERAAEVRDRIKELSNGMQEG